MECFGTCLFFIGRGTKWLGAVIAHTGWRGEAGWMPVVPFLCVGRCVRGYFLFPFFFPSHSRYFHEVDKLNKAGNIFLSNNVVKNMLPLLCGKNNLGMSLKFCSYRPYFVYCHCQVHCHNAQTLWYLDLRSLLMILGSLGLTGRTGSEFNTREGNVWFFLKISGGHLFSDWKPMYSTFIWYYTTCPFGSP